MIIDLKEKIKEIYSKNSKLEENVEMLEGIDFGPIQEILSALNEDNYENLSKALNKYNHCQHEILLKHEQHNKLGHLARQFQKSLIEFRDGLGARLPQDGTSALDVQSQIESVIGLTNDSAMTVLELAEQQAKTFKELKTESEIIETLIAAPIIDTKVKQSFEKINERMALIGGSLEESNRHLLMSQTFQDITGQILLRIKDFIDSVEGGLMEIVRMLASDEIDANLAEIDKNKLNNHCSQNDVDDLLSSLGF